MSLKCSVVGEGFNDTSILCLLRSCFQEILFHRNSKAQNKGRHDNANVKVPCKKKTTVDFYVQFTVNEC